MLLPTLPFEMLSEPQSEIAKYGLFRYLFHWKDGHLATSEIIVNPYAVSMVILQLRGLLYIQLYWA
jgi:hypothetical protein